MYKALWKDMKSMGILFYLVGLQLAALLLVTGKGAGQIYLDMFLILLLITLTAFFFAKVNRGNTKVVIYTMVLLTIGTMLQVIFKQESILINPHLYEHSNPAFGLQIQYLAALIGALGISFLYKKGRFMARPRVIKMMYLMSVFLYVITLVFARALGNVRNWIVIGGFSIQTSEINKLLYILIMSGLLGGTEKPSKKRIQFAFVVTLTNLFFLILQSEFGTILLLLAVFPVYLFLFVPDIKVVLYTLAGYSGIGLTVFGTGTCISKIAAGSERFAGISLVRFFLSNYNKIANRVIYWLHPEQDPMGLGYQLLKAREAILLGGWFGTGSISDLPVKTSDMVFPALIERCGILVAVLVLIVIVLLWLEGIRVFVRKKDKYHRAVCAGIVFMLFYQALIIVGGSCGMCPLTGITLPFISSGGSSLLVSAMMIGIVITISGRLEWEGEKEDEEMELEFKLFKKNADHPESFLTVCHHYADILIRISAVLPGISEEADQEKQNAEYAQSLKEYVRGPIVDRNGEILASSETPLGKRIYKNPKAFGSLLGYWSLIYGTSGIEKAYNRELATSECERKGDKVGSTVKLTIDSGLQTFAYNQIADKKGSLVVLDAKTGEILALTSSPSFNGNTLEENWDKLNQKEGILTSNAYQNAAIPGSIFKIITSAAILENKLEDEIVNDKGFLKVDGREISNSGGTVYGKLSLKEGFKKSSNVYFMTMGLKLGADTLEQMMSRFLIGEEIPLDFTTLKSNLDFDDYSDNMIATTAFGQGKTLITPLHMAMILQSIVNEGNMLKPYVISSVTNGKGETTKEGKIEALTTTVTKKVANEIKTIMTETGEKYGMTTLGKGEKIAAKTGTAQRGDGTNNGWMVSFAPADSPKYVVCINSLETKEFGISLKEETEAIYQYLWSHK